MGNNQPIERSGMFFHYLLTPRMQSHLHMAQGHNHSRDPHARIAQGKVASIEIRHLLVSFELHQRNRPTPHIRGPSIQDSDGHRTDKPPESPACAAARHGWRVATAPTRLAPCLRPASVPGSGATLWAIRRAPAPAPRSTSAPATSASAPMPLPHGWCATGNNWLSCVGAFNVASVEARSDCKMRISISQFALGH